MSELRRDPLNKRWVIIAADRGPRPTDFQLVTDPPGVGKENCPFCEGREDRTPPEILAVRPADSVPNGPGWRVRVIPNRYPALAIEGLPDRRGVGAYDRMHGIGAHEVIIETPRHEVETADEPLPHLTAIVNIWRSRIVDLMRDPRFKYVLLFKNQGSQAGASLDHPHAQIIATPITPRAVRDELDSSLSYHQVKERCLLCDLIAQEIEDGRRLVNLTDDFVVFAPYASRFPFELLLAPRRHQHEFGLAPDSLLPSFAAAMSDALKRLRTVLKRAPYNFVLHTAPNTNVLPRRNYYFNTLEYDWHWHVEIFPRVTRVAGFEWGSGLHINPTPPEDAARWLREADIS